MFKRWAILAVAAVCLAGLAGPRPVRGETPADIETPDELRVLSLTDLQRRVLEQVFHRHVFESPAPGGPTAAFTVKVRPTVPGGLYRLGSTGDLPVRLAVTIGSVEPLARISLRYYAEDFYGRKVADGTLPDILSDAQGLGAADLVVKELSAFGYYHVIVTAVSEERSASGACGVAVVHPAEGSLDPKSPFGLLAPPGQMAEDLPEIARRLGAAHLAFDWADGRHVANVATLSALPDSQPEFKWAEGEAELDAVAKAGLVPAGIVRYAIPQEHPEPPLLASLDAATVEHFAQTIHDWHLGRTPLLEGDLAKAAASCRTTVEVLLKDIRATKAPVSLFVGVTPGVLVGVLTEGPVLAGADGLSLCLDASAAAPNLRSGAYRRSLDYALQVARRAGVKRAIVGATGEDPAAASPQQQAWKVITRHVLSLAAGAERVYVSYGRGVPAPLPAAAAYAWMTHLVGGAAYQGSVWPEVPLLEAHLFAAADRRVAVVWSWVGENPDSPDSGALVFEEGSGLEARDVMGHPVGIWKNKRLIVPLGEAPIYIISSDLKADQVRDRLRRAKVYGIPPATLWLRSLAPGDAPGRLNATLWVQSQRPYREEAIAGLLVPEGWKVRQSKQQFGLDAGQAREATFEIDVPVAKDGSARRSDLAPPPYEITAAVSLGEEWVRRKQSVWPTQAPQRTIEVGYGVDDWEGIQPVVLRSPTGETRAEVRTAWDPKFFYFTAAVHRARDAFKGGPYAYSGDAIQLAWGASDRADDDFGNRGRDRGFPAGAFRDTDYLMALTFGKEGAQVMLLRRPKVTLRAHIPGNQDAWYGPVEGGQAEIWRDAEKKITYFEAAIPWKALAPLGGGRGKSFRFGFRVGDGVGRTLEWSRAAEVPDFLAGPGSFLPISDSEGLPCQTYWTLTGPVPGQAPKTANRNDKGTISERPLFVAQPPSAVLFGSFARPRAGVPQF